jgi:hypothetical protein
MFIDDVEGKTMTNNLQTKIQRFAKLLEKQQIKTVQKEYPSLDAQRLCRVSVRPGKKYTKVDVGNSGKYMVDNEGKIWGIKAYGVVHKGHYYGTLDTIDDYYWGGYTAVKKG